MSSHRDERLSAELIELAGKYIAREAGRETLITPTRVVLGKEAKTATIMVSVFPESEIEHALSFLERHKDLFRDYMKKSSRMGRLPFVRFEFDYGEQNRQRMDELSKEVQDGVAE